MASRVYVYDRLGRTIRHSNNLRAVLVHNTQVRGDVVVKVVAYPDYRDYDVTFFWSDGSSSKSRWGDWRVLLDWLKARRSWSISRVTFDAPLYDQHEADPRFASFRKHCAPLTRHAYQDAA